MNKMVRKVFLAVITLLLAVTTFTGVTFAWLSINSDAWVEGMQIQATTGKGFLVSVDGYNYTSSIDQEQIIKAILIKYRKSYSLNEQGELLNENNIVISKNNYQKLFKEIRFEPCTSYGTEGIELTNLYGTKIDVSKGEYIEFDIYFKSTGDVKEDMPIYLNGAHKTLTQDTASYNINPTKLTSAIDEIKLQCGLITYDKETGEAIQKQEDEILKVRSSNALRLGIQNESGVASIIELTDQYDLGSYATNIKDYIDSDDFYHSEDIVYDAAYDAYKNAMFTYTSQVTSELEPLDYKKIPKTIKSLINSEGLNTVKILTLTKEQQTQKATFRIWLEGWDADCIDGLKQSITVQLSFVQQ